MNTVNKKEIEKFSKFAQEWWDPFGKFKPLHKLNPVRAEFIRDKLITHFKLNARSNEPLKKLNILDIGCGGGILSEPIARMGGKVTGIDVSKKNIEVAKAHAHKMGMKINYINSALEQMDFKNSFDVIVNMEVIEHVANPKLFIQNCARVLKKNGFMFIATINKNLKSYLYAIIGAEYLLRWLPIGTHNWDNFFKPQELQNLALKYSLSLKDLTGIKFNLLLGKWEKNKDTSVNYIATFIKN